MHKWLREILWKGCNEMNHREMVGFNVVLYFRKQLVLNVALAPDRERTTKK